MIKVSGAFQLIYELAFPFVSCLLAFLTRLTVLDEDSLVELNTDPSFLH